MAILPRSLKETARRAVGVNIASGKNDGVSPDWVKWALTASISISVLGCAGTRGALQRTKARLANFKNNISCVRGEQNNSNSTSRDAFL